MSSEIIILLLVVTSLIGLSLSTIVFSQKMKKEGHTKDAILMHFYGVGLFVIAMICFFIL